MIKTLVLAATCAVFASLALAQNLVISQPAANSTIKAGTNITVKLDRPRSLTGSQDVAVAIGLVSCASFSDCPDPAARLGQILYSGLYAPQSHDDGGSPYQTFTVAVPSGYSGPVQLGVAHFFLLAAGPSAQLQVAQTTLQAVKSG